MSGDGGDGKGRDGRLGYLLLASITLFWGVNWPAIKLSVGVLTAWEFRLISACVGGFGLLAVALLGGESLAVPRRQVGPLLLCSLFNIVGWQLFSAFGVLLMPSGRAAILAFTMPLWASLFAIPLLGERLTGIRVCGLLLGLAGLGVLVGPDLVVFENAPLGAGFMILAAVSWGLGTVLLKRFHWSLATTALAGWQQVAGALVIAAAGAVVGGFDVWPTQVSPTSLAAVAYAVSVPMIYCMWAYMHTVRLLPAPVAAIGTLAVPVVGVFSGALLLGEPVGLREVGSLALICSALAVVMVLPAWRARHA